MAIAKAAAAFGPALGGVGTAVVAFVPAALVSGSALAGMLLGHWYLVAPNLSFRPLRRAIDIVFAAVAFQALVIVLVILTATSAVRGELLWSGDAFPFWLLVVGSGIVFTTGVALLDAPLRQDPRQSTGDRDALRAHHQRGHGRRPRAPAVLRHRRPHLGQEVRASAPLKTSAGSSGPERLV